MAAGNFGRQAQRAAAIDCHAHARASFRKSDCQPCPEWRVPRSSIGGPDKLDAPAVELSARQLLPSADVQDVERRSPCGLADF